MQVPCTPDTYFDFIRPETLPEGVTEYKPCGNRFSICDEHQVVTNCFLLKNPKCVTNACRLTGGSTIRTGKGQPAFTFGGNVWPGCNSQAGDGGNWNVVAHALKLHFQGTVIDMPLAFLQ